MSIEKNMRGGNQEKKQALSIDMIDLFAGTGLTALTAGIWMLSGTAWALIAAGVILLVIGLAGALIKNIHGGNP